MIHVISRHFGCSRLFFLKSFSVDATGGGRRFSISSCVALLKSCDSMISLRQIHAKIFRVGLHENMDTLTKLMVFCIEPCRGDIRYAERIFGSVQIPCLIMYNLMIKGFAKNEHFREVLILFGELRVRGLEPDNFTYPFVLKAIGCLGKVLDGEKVHGCVVKTGLEFDAYVCNSLMGMYAAVAKVGITQKLFDEMPEKDVVSWNVLISSYVGHGMFRDAIAVFRRMREQSHLKPDEATIVSTLSACAALKNLEVGGEILRYISREVELTSKMGNALLDMYCKCGCLDKAMQVFDMMGNKNVICWTTMVSGYANCGRLDEARELFERSPVRDIILWTAIINGHIQYNQFDEALELFRQMQYQGIRPDKYIVVALLTGCAQIGALEQGKWIHGYIDSNGMMDTVVGTALIEMYAKCGCIEKALEIFYKLKQKDTTSWTSIICGLAMNGMSGKALEVFAEMERVGVTPDEITFIGVLSACSHGGLIEEGRRIFYSIFKRYKIQPKLEHYGCLIDLLGRAGLLDEAEALINNIPSGDSETVVPLYSSLLSACRIHGNVKMGEQVAAWLERGKFADSSVHTLLGSIYASANRWEDVRNVRRRMKDLGVRKFPGCSSIEINGVVEEFLVGDPWDPKMEEIHSMLRQMTRLMLGLEHEEMFNL